MLSGAIALELSSEYCFDDGSYTIIPQEQNHDYLVHMTVDQEGESFEKALSNTEFLSNGIINARENQLDEYDEEILNALEKEKETALANIEDIILFFSPEEAAQLVRNNPTLKTKRLLFYLDNLFDISFVERIEESLLKETENIFINVPGNREPISISEYKETIKAIDQLAQKVENFDYSPIEKMMHAYDLVRDRNYQQESENEETWISRDLSKALLGDKIVCLGFANIYCAVLKSLGIRSEVVYLRSHEPNKPGHAIVIAYIEDQKYGITGAYYFDPTKDGKGRGEDTRFLESYAFFAKTKNELEKFENRKYIDAQLKYMTPNFPWDLYDMIDPVERKDLSTEVIQTINYMSRIVLGKQFLPKKELNPSLKYICPEWDAYLNSELAKADLYHIISSFDNPIDGYTMLEVMYQVRKNQYYENPDKYNIDVETLSRMAVISMWNFDDSEDYLLLPANPTPMQKAIFFLQLKEKREEAILAGMETGVFKRAEQIRLTKTLQLIKEKRNS